MIQPTVVTWVLVIFGAVFIFLLLLYAQLLMVLRPRSQAAQDLLIGKGEAWRDKTHFRMSLGSAWADTGAFSYTGAWPWLSMPRCDSLA